MMAVVISDFFVKMLMIARELIVSLLAEVKQILEI